MLHTHQPVPAASLLADGSQAPAAGGSVLKPSVTVVQMWSQVTRHSPEGGVIALEANRVRAK